MRMRMMTMAGRATNAFACRAQAAHGQIQHSALCKDEVARERESLCMCVCGAVVGGGVVNGGFEASKQAISLVTRREPSLPGFIHLTFPSFTPPKQTKRAGKRHTNHDGTSTSVPCRARDMPSVVKVSRESARNTESTAYTTSCSAHWLFLLGYCASVPSIHLVPSSPQVRVIEARNISPPGRLTAEEPIDVSIQITFAGQEEVSKGRKEWGGKGKGKERGEGGVLLGKAGWTEWGIFGGRMEDTTSPLSTIINASNLADAHLLTPSLPPFYSSSLRSVRLFVARPWPRSGTKSFDSRLPRTPFSRMSRSSSRCVGGLTGGGRVKTKEEGGEARRVSLCSVQYFPLCPLFVFRQQHNNQCRISPSIPFDLPIFPPSLPPSLRSSNMTPGRPPAEKTLS